MNTPTLSERLQNELELYRKLMLRLSVNINVCKPGVITEVNVDSGVPTVTVQLVIREYVVINGNGNWETIPLLLDVPLFIQEGGGYLFIPPVSIGDECLVFIADTCIDAWWKYGGTQNQVIPRRHSLSDGFAIVGFRNQTRSIPNYPTNTAQLRNQDGTVQIELTQTDINITASSVVNVISPQVNLSDGTLRQLVDSRFESIFNNHTHGGVRAGGGTTTGVSNPTPFDGNCETSKTKAG